MTQRRNEERTFEGVKENELQTLRQYVPIVDKVHGRSHPEFHEVRALFEEIIRKTEDAREYVPELDETFRKLRMVTGDYKVPEDVCESYEAVYMMLKSADEIYKRG